VHSVTHSWQRRGLRPQSASGRRLEGGSGPRSEAGHSRR
jgi:hypothetical protein